MRRPIITQNLLEKNRTSLISTGKWTISSQSWSDKFHESVFRVVFYRFHMVGIIYKDL